MLFHRLMLDDRQGAWPTERPSRMEGGYPPGCMLETHLRPVRSVPLPLPRFFDEGIGGSLLLRAPSSISIGLSESGTKVCRSPSVGSRSAKIQKDTPRRIFRRSGGSQARSWPLYDSPHRRKR